MVHKILNLPPLPLHTEILQMSFICFLLGDKSNKSHDIDNRITKVVQSFIFPECNNSVIYMTWEYLVEVYKVFEYDILIPNL